MVQLDTACSRYDSSLFYTLIPNKKFSFSNIEFTTGYATNSMGLRDDEMSLDKPPIIVMGDSYAMGWGVQQDQTFAQQIEKITGKKVLNTAISSYGTARELKNLYRLDTSCLRYLIIQYCRNDDDENKSFIDNNYVLKVSPQTFYDSIRLEHYWSKLYFPGKYLFTNSRFFLSIELGKLSKKWNRQKQTGSNHSEMGLIVPVRHFIDILFNSPINFGKTKVLVIDMNEKIAMNDEFINKADSLQYTSQYQKKFNGNLFFIPVSKMLTDKDYYILDAHIRESGHRKLAELLSRYLSFP